MTFLLEYPQAEERKVRLAALRGIEDRCWVQVQGFDKIWSIADEDLERENDEKTSSVHFLRFELTREMCERVREGAEVSIGIDHPNYSHVIESLPTPIRNSLANDLVHTH